MVKDNNKDGLISFLKELNGKLNGDLYDMGNPRTGWGHFNEEEAEELDKTVSDFLAARNSQLTSPKKDFISVQKELIAGFGSFVLTDWCEPNQDPRIIFRTDFDKASEIWKQLLDLKDLSDL